MLRTNATFSIDNKYTDFQRSMKASLLLNVDEQDHSQFQTFIGKGVGNVIIFVVYLKIFSI